MPPATLSAHSSRIAALDVEQAALVSLLSPSPALHVPETLDLERFLSLVSAHRIEWPLLERLESVCSQTENQAPPWTRQVVERLKQSLAGERLRWILKCKAAEELAARLSERGAAAVFLKGFAYARELYASPEQRPFNDLDVLIRREDLAAVHEVLLSLSYEPSKASQGLGAIEQSYYKTMAPGFVLDIDLHWDLVGRESLNREMRLDPERFLERSLDRGRGIRVLSPEDAMIFAAVNLVVHCYSPLQQFHDFKLMTGRPLDWDLLLKRARECRVRSALSAGLSIASEWFGAEIPELASSELRLAWWQRMALKRLLKVEHLIRPERFMEAGARYGLKVLSQDSLGAVLRTLLYIPWGYLKRLRNG